jgi:hypothetical protein
MSEHPSDLALERLLAGEVDEDVLAHVRGCDMCWRRWAHMHVDEGLPLPLRHPEPATVTPPWRGVALALAAALLVSVGLQATQPAAPSRTDAAEVTVMRQEAIAMRKEITQLRAELETARGAVDAGTQGAGKKPSVQDVQALRVALASKGAAVGADRPLTADDIPREVLDAAVEQEVEDRALAKLDAVQEEAKVKEQARIRKVLDALVDKARMTPEEASAVEVLLWNEFDETWQIKEDTVGGHLSKEDAMADWEALRAETDAAVREIVPDAVAEDLWRSMSGK